ncbi:MAG: KH domain-containing protein [Xenococcaceae cyanobacterium]
MPKPTAISDEAEHTSPDYTGLVKFLLKPFLDSPECLSVDCEQSKNNQRVWIRLAFEGTDKGRVFGRGGRNIQAIRTVLNTAAAAASQSLYLDIYGSQHNTTSNRDNGSGGKQGIRRRRSRRSATPKPWLKSRPQ